MDLGNFLGNKHRLRVRASARDLKIKSDFNRAKEEAGFKIKRKSLLRPGFSTKSIWDFQDIFI